MVRFDDDAAAGVEETTPPMAQPVSDDSSDDLAGKQQTTTSTTPQIHKAYHFHNMAAHPWPYLLFLPIMFILLIGFGWTRDDIVEDEVAQIWIPTSGDYAQDLQYARDHGNGGGTLSSFAAMSISRNGDNIFTQSQLEEISSRMVAMENTTVEHNGQTFTWQDMCGSNPYPYEFPCARLSPMDYFQEAQLSFDHIGNGNTDNTQDNTATPANARVTWYREIMQELLVRPRIPRFGTLTTTCVSPDNPVCVPIVLLRTNPALVGMPELEANPLALFSDIGNMELSDPCRICVETNYEATVQQLFQAIVPTFQVAAFELNRTLVDGNITDADERAMLGGLLQTTAPLAADGAITLTMVQDFYQYFVARGVYGQLGAAAYQAGYEAFLPLFTACAAIPGLTCPNADAAPDTTQAMAALLRHADGDFSSLSTAGSPLPIWGETEEGVTAMFAGDSPVSGSGIDMSGTLLSTIAYFDVLNFGSTPEQDWNPVYANNGFFMDVTDPLFTAMVLQEPMFAWFTAGNTPADPESVCANGNLPGTQTGIEALDAQTAGAGALASSQWCTEFNVPNEDTGGPIADSEFSVQYFARMWYDLLIDSDSFLGVTQGKDDPYSWTTGQGCGYTLGGQRNPYSGATDAEILANASGELYYIDEGESVGAIDRNLLMGDTFPIIGAYDAENPLQRVGLVQSLYASLTPKAIVNRVKNCKRPDGGIEISEEDAEEVLKLYKEKMEDAWTEGWDDPNAGDVQFVGFFDDRGAVGSTGRMLQEITLDNTALTIISIALIAIFSVLFLFSFDWVESRVLITLVGVALVVLAFFGAIGFAILIGTKISITIAWTLPFVILGLGVDDMYIVLMAIKSQGGFGEHHYLRAMKEVVVPVTMTSLVNAAMFGLMGGISDIPAVFLSARCALYSVVLLYGAIIFCFPAYCYLDMRRQRAGRKDVLVCLKQENPPSEGRTEDWRNYLIYDKFYKPLVLNEKKSRRLIVHLLIMLASGALFGVGAWGITEREIGLGLEDFFPEDNPAHQWAVARTESLASWTMGMSWGALNYTDPDTQMLMIKQFEDVIGTSQVSEANTIQLWMADFLIWGTRMCSANFDRPEFDELLCGRDQLHEPSESLCSAQWTENVHGLRLKTFTEPTDTVCKPFKGGICRPGEKMHASDLEDLGLTAETAAGKEFCPVVGDWSDEKWQFCLREWRSKTGFGGGGFVLEESQGSDTDCPGVFENDENITWPILITTGPTMFSFDLTSHQATLDMMDETRSFCDDDPDLHCWLSGIAFDYWTQYQGIFDVLLELGGYSTLVGFVISFLFLVTKLGLERRHPFGKVFCGSLIGALLIAVTIVMTLVTVVGLSVLSGVSQTGFSNMSFVLSVGFAVEYAVHIVARWLRADLSHVTSLSRVEFTMSFLMLPTFMSFVSSTIGVACLAFTDFEFNKTFFFKPLIIVMFTSYFFGCWFLPTLLVYLDFDTVKLGKAAGTKSEYLSASTAGRIAKELEGLDASSKPIQKSQSSVPVASVTTVKAQNKEAEGPKDVWT